MELIYNNDDFYYIGSFRNKLNDLLKDIDSKIYLPDVFPSNKTNGPLKKILSKLLLLIPYMDRFSCNTIECVLINYHSFLCEIKDQMYRHDDYDRIMETLFFFIEKNEILPFRGKGIIEEYLNIKRDDYETEEEYLNAFNKKYYETKIRMIMDDSIYKFTLNEINKKFIDLIISFRINEPSCMFDLIYYIIQNIDNFNYHEYRFMLSSTRYILLMIKNYYKTTPNFIDMLNKTNRLYAYLSYSHLK